jgi:hypothetical protein
MDYSTTLANISDQFVPPHLIIKLTAKNAIKTKTVTALKTAG